VTVVFDGGQTLWDFDGAAVRALGETRIAIARATGMSVVSVPSIEQLLKLRREVGERMRAGARVACPRRDAFTAALKLMGDDASPETVDHITEFFISRRHEMCRPYLESVPILTALRETYAVVLLTNANPHLDRIGLRDVFDRVFCAEEVGMAKPDQNLYRQVAEACGTAMVSVGDSLVDDVLGPQRAGWRAVWINRDGLGLPHHVKPDAVLNSLGGLDTALKTIVG